MQLAAGGTDWFGGHWIWREEEEALLSKLEAMYRNYLGSLKMQPPEALSVLLVLPQNLQGRDTGICCFTTFSGDSEAGPGGPKKYQGLRLWSQIKCLSLQLEQ